jgi:hypothetical protein
MFFSFSELISFQHSKFIILYVLEIKIKLLLLFQTDKLGFLTLFNT